MVSVIWFRRDLRLEDDIALAKAIRYSEQLLAVFHLNPDQLTNQTTPNQSAFLQDFLVFKESLAENGITLHLMTGDLPNFLGSVHFPVFFFLAKPVNYSLV
ncbi:deoxyribodipyrimidine photo-lyase [Streptococcus pluranimalium]|uniref:deoxyribodipyrimidine photo-lyase n=1 Tax=Streptococcus pluranimalium TaxID=82348 RepID=UPI003138E5D8